MGTPLADTPVVIRRKRDDAISTMQEEKSDPVYSSQYFGIEKEVEAKPSQSNGTSSRAIVYEGKVRVTLCEF